MKFFRYRFVSHTRASNRYLASNTYTLPPSPPLPGIAVFFHNFQRDSTRHLDSSLDTSRLRAGFSPILMLVTEEEEEEEGESNRIEDRIKADN